MRVISLREILDFECAHIKRQDLKGNQILTLEKCVVLEVCIWKAGKSL